LILFDYHEDVVIFSEEFNPKSAGFYQIKTKSNGNWTLKGLAKCTSAGHETSILRKLFVNYECFPQFASELVFVSNQRLKTKTTLKPSAHLVDHVLFEDLHVDEKTICSLASEANTKKVSCVEGLSKFRFERTVLTPSDHSTQTKGKLADFFDDLFPSKAVNSSLAYRSILDEVSRKNNCEDAIHDVTELIERKGISRRQFNEMVSVIVGRRSDSELWAEASLMLTTDGASHQRIRAIHQAWERVIIFELDSANEQFALLSEQVALEIDSLPVDHKITVTTLAENIFDRLDDVEQNVFDINTISALICREFTRNEPLQKTSTRTEKEKP